MTTKCIDHNYVGKASGYAQVCISGVTTYIHRHVYANSNGMDVRELKGKVVMHTCDNPRCINPEHLALGSQADNMADMVDKKRSLTGIKNHQAKLSDHQVKAIRLKRQQCGYTIKQLALEFNCGTSQICRIINNQSRRL